MSRRHTAYPRAHPADGCDSLGTRPAEQALPAASRSTLRIALEMPPGLKLNSGAPATLAVSVRGEGVRVPPAYRTQTLPALDPNLAVPLDAGPPGARALLQVDLAFVICRSDDQGICSLHQVVWEAPVHSQSQARQSTLILHYKVRPF